MYANLHVRHIEPDGTVTTYSAWRVVAKNPGELLVRLDKSDDKRPEPAGEVVLKLSEGSVLIEASW